jgi:hypothetical protein
MAKKFTYSKEPDVEAIALALGIDPSSITYTKSRGEIVVEFASDLAPANVQKLDALFVGFRRAV